jgi:hypothetical protein
MSVPVLARRRRLLERPAPWLLFTLFSTLGALFVALFTAAGGLREYELFPALLRGYTPIGALLGAGAAFAALFTLFYSFRKRWFQESLPFGRGTLAMWLWAHVAFGLLALVLATLHGGYGVVSLQPTSGKALYLLLLAVAASGVLWRLVYAWVPPSAARDVGNYSSDASLSRAEAHLVEIEKLAAGRSPRLRELAAWITENPVDPVQAGTQASALGLDEQRIFSEIVRLAVERHAALDRARRQRRYVARLQGLRVFHTPISVLFVLLLPIHVLFAYDVPEKLLAVSPAGASLGGFESAATCARCHARVVDEWRSSMHAHALSGPVMRAQTNLAARTTLSAARSPDPKQICVNCHAPLAARIAPSATLPLSAPALGDPDLVHEGVTCVVCHTFDGESQTGGGGLTRFQSDLNAGRSYFGSIAEPVGNAFHKSASSPVFTAPERLCQNCHSVVYDKNADGKIEKGIDLVLQDLFSEWQAYRAAGGAHCVDCHMPLVAGQRAAESASIPFEQDETAPARQLRSHRFVGPDFPLEDPAVRDETRPERDALLARAAALTIDPGSARFDGQKLSLNVSVANIGSGHNLPGGFAFVRQMWIELRVLSAANRVLASSGVLPTAAHDLCETSVLAPDSSVRDFVAGCAAADPALVLFQQRLLDRIEPARDAAGNPAIRAAPGALEVVVQHLDGGPVPRLRGVDGKPMPPLAPGERRSFAYSFPLADTPGTRPVRIEARLLFRTTPPYFLRALAKTQEPGDGPRLDGYIANLEIAVMASASTAVARN